MFSSKIFVYFTTRFLAPDLFQTCSCSVGTARIDAMTTTVLLRLIVVASFASIYVSGTFDGNHADEWPPYEDYPEDLANGVDNDAFDVIELASSNDDDVSAISSDAASLAFVFDTTGSMYDDLVQVIEGAAKILATTLAMKDKPLYNYILVPFHDPGRQLPSTL